MKGQTPCDLAGYKFRKTFAAACDVAADYGEQLAAEGEICWGGMHGWKHMLDLLEQTDRKGIIGFQADMAHTLLYTQGFNAPENRIVGPNFNWDRDELSAALKTMTNALRPWTIDFHVAQNDATVKGMGSHDKTGRHCQPFDPVATTAAMTAWPRSRLLDSNQSCDRFPRRFRERLHPVAGMAFYSRSPCLDLPQIGRAVP